MVSYGISHCYHHKAYQTKLALSYFNCKKTYHFYDYLLADRKP